MRNGRFMGVGALLAVIALAAAACGGNDSNGTRGGLSGQIVISGSSTVEPISGRVAELFNGEEPDVEVSVDGPGTSDGFELFCNGETDISDASRAIKEEEITNCEKEGIEFVELKVAIDGLSVITSNHNDEVECLGFKDLYALLGIESQGFENWSDANDLGEELGASHAPYPDAPLSVTAPGEESGTFDSFAEIALEDIAYEERNIEEDSPVVRPDYQASANDNVIIEGVAGSEDNSSTLGWVGYAFYANTQDTVKALAIEDDESGECIEPDPDTISGGEYPIARDLFIYVNKDKADSNEAARSYVDFYLSDEGLAAVSEAGYVDLADEDLEATRQAWEDQSTGTREG